MGRVITLLADALALARLALEVRAAWRANARLGAPADLEGAPDVGGPTETTSPDGAGGVGPPGPSTGAAAGSGAGTVSGPVTRG